MNKTPDMQFLRGGARLLLLAITVAACTGSNGNPGGTGSDAFVTIGGTVSGVEGSGVILINRTDGETVDVHADGTFTFLESVAYGADYDVAVDLQPAAPTQQCTVVNGTGKALAPVTDIVVTCKTLKFTVGGTVTGLEGSGLVLEDNGGDDLAISAGSATFPVAFTFPTPIASEATFAVTVKTQPSGPPQTCTVSGGAGIVGSSAVTSVVVNCAADRFTIGGTITGLAGSVELADNGGDHVVVSSNGSFAFPTTVETGSSYDVTVALQPQSPSQTCVVTNGAGTVDAADVTSVQVACTTNRFKIGGQVTGLAGTGLVLEDNNGDDLPVSASGAFVFATPVPSGQTYSVTVRSQPSGPPQTCRVVSGTGTVYDYDVTNIYVTCTTDTFMVGGTVTGLAGGGLVLQDNGGDSLWIAGDGSFAFPTPIASGDTYAVTVSGQPSAPTQTCTVSNGTGTIGTTDVTGVAVTCTTSTFTISGTVTGLLGSGLVLHDTAGDDLAIGADSSFTFPTAVPSGTSFAVTVRTQPTGPSQTCAVANGTGVLESGDVTNVAVTCTTDAHAIGGTVTGLVGGSVVLEDNGGDDLAISANGTFRFPTAVASGATYDVTVRAQPFDPSQTCTVGAGSGTVGSTDVTGVAITCATDAYVVGGAASGLTGSGLVLEDNGGDDLSIGADGIFTFATPVASGASYAVTIKAQPAGQTCRVIGGTGTIATGDLASVLVECAADRYAIAGTVSGLAGTLVLQDVDGDYLAVTANGSFAFRTPVASGATYDVTVATEPSSPNQTCVVSNGAGTVTSADITDLVITCTVDRLAVGGTLWGLAAGESVVLRDNGGDDVTLTANGSFTFPTSVASGLPYAITVAANPASPIAQTCTIEGGRGTVGDAAATGASVTCKTNQLVVGGTVTGLAGGGLVLQDNGGDDLAIAASGAFAFPTPIASGDAYAVTILSQPSGSSCFVTNGTGTVGAAGPSVQITCTSACRTVNGVRWCYNANACGQACNDVCASLGLPLTIDDATWFQAQDSLAKCEAISNAFGLGDDAAIGYYAEACLEDSGAAHGDTAPGGPSGNLNCSSDMYCPGNHRVLMDLGGVACGQAGATRSICPCQ